MIDNLMIVNAFCFLDNSRNYGSLAGWLKTAQFLFKMHPS